MNCQNNSQSNKWNIESSLLECLSGEKYSRYIKDVPYGVERECTHNWIARCAVVDCIWPTG